MGGGNGAGLNKNRIGSSFVQGGIRFLVLGRRQQVTGRSLPFRSYRDTSQHSKLKRIHSHTHAIGHYSDAT